MVFDVDVVGGCNIKKFYGDRALSVFIQPPSVEEPRKRLVGRGTDAPEVIEARVAKAGRIDRPLGLGSSPAFLFISNEILPFGLCRSTFNLKKILIVN